MGENGGNDVYLTSFEDVSKEPQWLKGEGEGDTGKTGVVVVVEKDGGVVDVFYFFFFAFNWGGVVLGKQLGMVSIFGPFNLTARRLMVLC